MDMCKHGQIQNSSKYQHRFNFVNTHYRKHIERIKNFTAFKRAMHILCTNADFQEMYEHAMLSGGAFQVVNLKM